MKTLIISLNSIKFLVGSCQKSKVISCHLIDVMLTRVTNIICLVWDISLGDADIQLAMIDIQIVSYQSRQKLFKIFYNILYWNQCWSPSLALTVWSYRKKGGLEKANMHPLFIHKSGDRPGLHLIEQALPHTLRFCSLHVFML